MLSIADKTRAWGWCVLALALAVGVMSSCGAPEDPARAALRVRLAEPRQISPEELTRLREEVSRAIAGKSILMQEDGITHPLGEDQYPVVFGMLSDPAGLFDEGLRTADGRRLRILNAPGVSNNAEIEASRRLLVDIDTLVPARFEFTYAFQGHGDYAFNLIVQE